MHGSEPFIPIFGALCVSNSRRIAFVLVREVVDGVENDVGVEDLGDDVWGGLWPVRERNEQFVMFHSKQLVDDDVG